MRKIKPSWGVWVCLAALGCSGRYEVGANNGQGGKGSEANGNAGSIGVGAASQGVGGASGSAAGASATASAGAATVACWQTPTPFAGPFASPQVVWNRLSLLIFDGVVTPPDDLPEATTAEWASDTVSSMIDTAMKGEGPATVRRFFTQSLELDAASGLPAKWSPILLKQKDALRALFVTALGEPGRIGVLSETEWLAKHPSIPARGRLIMSALMGSQVPPPPPNIQFPPVQTNQSRRVYMEQAVVQPLCGSCHALINPGGFSLEHFDAKGTYRTVDAGAPVDSSGVFQIPLDGGRLSFTSIEDLAPQLVATCDASNGFADAHLLQAMQTVGLGDVNFTLSQANAEDQARVRQAFGTEKSYRSLLQAIAQTEAFLR
jgi:hypothetical protein